MILTGVAPAFNRVALTDADGRFSFRNLAPGRITLAATKSGFVSRGFGQPGRGEPPLEMVLEAGSPAEDIVLQLDRGAVITGRLVDPSGAPLPGVAVSALERRDLGGVVRFARANGSITDDAGRYRIFGLAPGTYAIGASMAALQAGAGVFVPPEEVRMAPQMAPARSALAHVFAPGTTDPTHAQLITLEAGQELNGVEFAAQLTPATEVSALMTLADGRPVSNVVATITAVPDNPSIALGEPRSRPVPLLAGRFTQQLQPGRYTLAVRANRWGAGQPRDAATTPQPTYPELWSVSTFEVTAGAVRILPAAELRPGVVVRINVVGQAEVGADGGPLIVRLSPESRRSPLFDLPTVPVLPGGPGLATVPPGRYYVDVVVARGTPWQVASAHAGAVDLFDAPVVAGENGQIDIQITLTKRLTELTGHVRDREGRAVTDVFLLAFPVDPAHRLPESQRLRPAVRPASDGTYRMTGLPPGDYLLAALTAWEPRYWTTPELLRELEPGAVRVTIAEDGPTVQGVMVAR